MDYQDINSPLPPRQTLSDDSSSPPPQTNMPSVSTPSSSPEKKPPRSLPVKKSLPIASLFIILLIAALIYVVVKVVIPTFSPNSRVVTLNYWGLWEDTPILDAVIADFETKNPNIKINYRLQQKNDYRTRLAGRLTKDPDVEEVPDIFRIHSSWLPMFVNELAPVPDSTVKKIALDSDYYTVYQHDLKASNNFLAIPLMYDGLSLFYNIDLLEKSQTSLPKSWWDLQTIAGNLTVRDSSGRLQIAGVAMGLTDNVDHWNDIVGILLKQNGANLIEAKSDEQIQAALTYYSNFYKEYKTWDESMPSSTQAFAQGKLVFYFAPSWRVFNIEELNPSLRFAITTVPQMPTLEGDLTNIHWATYWAEGVRKSSPHQKEAWKFLEYLSSREVLEKLFTAASQTRSFGEIYPRISMASLISSNVKIKPFISVANDAESGYLSSRTFDAGLNTELSKYFSDAINNIIQKSVDPATVIPPLRSGINQIVQKYNLK